MSTRRTRRPRPVHAHRRPHPSDPNKSLLQALLDPGVNPGFEIAAPSPGQQVGPGDDTWSAHADGTTVTRFNAQAGASAIDPAKNRRVGWTLRNEANEILPDAAFGFTINPQGITYEHTARNQLFATKGNFYVNDFGPGPTTITLRQLVASGGYNDQGVYAVREDVLAFVTQIWEPAVARSREKAPKPRVFFHDTHLDATSGAGGFRVFFPASSLSIQRSVDLHNVWLVQITMQTLHRNPYGPIRGEVAADAARRKNHYIYIVHAGETLHRIARKAIGTSQSKYHHRYSLEAMVKLIVRLNPQLVKKRTVGNVDIHGNTTTITVAPMHVTPGDRLALPK